MASSPQIARWPSRFASVLVAAYALAGLAVFIYALALGGEARTTLPVIVVFYVGPLVFTIAMALVLRLSSSVRLAVALNVGAIFAAIYGFQAYTDLARYIGNMQRMAAMEVRTGIAFDRRSQGEVIADLRARGDAAYPAHARRFLPLPLRDGADAIFPLSGRSARTTVLCNEYGAYSIYKADRYGFNNPDALWDAPAVDIVAVGDSFTHGACVPPEANAVARLRETVPRTLNLGMGGSGSLFHLAVIDEYAALVKPKVVLWFYYENDLANLLSEALNPQLAAYLQPGHTQRLAARQAKIDAAIDNFVESVMRGMAYERFHWRRRLADFVLLREVREKLGLGMRSEIAADRAVASYDEAIRLFERALVRARDDVGTWGGKLVFVFIPSWSRYGDADFNPGMHRRDEVLAAVARLGLPLIDLHPAMASNSRAAEEYFFYAGSHFTPEGYALVATTIRQALARHGLP